MEILDGNQDDYRYCFHGFADFNDQFAAIVNAFEWIWIWWLLTTNRDDGFAEKSADEETDADATQIVLMIILSFRLHVLFCKNR